MNLIPIRNKVLLELEPEDRRYHNLLWLPDEDSIRYCRKCHQLMEALSNNPRCRVGTDDFAFDKYHTDRLNYVGTDFTHDITSITAPVVASLAARAAVVLAIGPWVHAVAINDHVLVDQFAGGTRELIRIVREDTILAHLEA